MEEKVPEGPKTLNIRKMEEGDLKEIFQLSGLEFAVDLWYIDKHAGSFTCHFFLAVIFFPLQRYLHLSHGEGCFMFGGIAMVNEERHFDHLKTTNQDFRKWVNLHSELEVKLEGLNRLKYLTVEEEVEKKRLQKQKLFAKDQIHFLLYRF